MDFRDLPTLNAMLNFTSGFLVAAGIYHIRHGNKATHRIYMMAAVAVSSLFLISYLLYHYQVGSVPFERDGWIRTVYLSILMTHTVLAAAVVPMVIRSVYLAYTEQFDKHRRFARWTYPIWIYVSATGVVVYLMLYQM